MKKETYMTKLTYSEISAIVGTMTETTRSAHDSYAFPAGYLSSVVSELIVDLPVRRQAEVIRSLQNLTAKYAK